MAPRKIVTKKPSSIPGPKTMKVQNLSGQGLEVLFQVDGAWQHYWVDGSQTIDVPDVPLSQTASELIRRQVIAVYRS